MKLKLRLETDFDWGLVTGHCAVPLCNRNREISHFTDSDSDYFHTGAHTTLSIRHAWYMRYIYTQWESICSNSNILLFLCGNINMKYYLSTLIELLYDLDRPPSLVWFTVGDITLIESVTKCNVWLLHRREVERRFPVVPWSVTSVSCVWTVQCRLCSLYLQLSRDVTCRGCLCSPAPPAFPPRPPPAAGLAVKLVHTAQRKHGRAPHWHRGERTARGDLILRALSLAIMLTLQVMSVPLFTLLTDRNFKTSNRSQAVRKR